MKQIDILQNSCNIYNSTVSWYGKYFIKTETQTLGYMCFEGKGIGLTVVLYASLSHSHY